MSNSGRGTMDSTRHQLRFRRDLISLQEAVRITELSSGSPMTSQNDTPASLPRATEKVARLTVDRAGRKIAFVWHAGRWWRRPRKQTERLIAAEVLVDAALQ